MRIFKTSLLLSLSLACVADAGHATKQDVADDPSGCPMYRLERIRLYHGEDCSVNEKTPDCAISSPTWQSGYAYRVVRKAADGKLSRHRTVVITMSNTKLSSLTLEEQDALTELRTEEEIAWDNVQGEEPELEDDNQEENLTLESYREEYEAARTARETFLKRMTKKYGDLFDVMRLRMYHTSTYQRGHWPAESDLKAWETKEVEWRNRDPEGSTQRVLDALSAVATPNKCTYHDPWTGQQVDLQPSIDNLHQQLCKDIFGCECFEDVQACNPPRP